MVATREGRVTYFQMTGGRSSPSEVYRCRDAWLSSKTDPDASESSRQLRSHSQRSRTSSKAHR